jgi:hypothetical protein
MRPAASHAARKPYTRGRLQCEPGRDGSGVAYFGEAADVPSDVWNSSASGPPKRLTALNSQVVKIRLGAMKEIIWKNPKDVQLIFGLVILIPPQPLPFGKELSSAVSGGGGIRLIQPI